MNEGLGGGLVNWCALLQAGAVLCLLAVLSPVQIRAQVEIAGPNVIISPYDHWPDPQMGRFYNPAGVRVGGTYYLYVQGGVYNLANGGPGADCPVTEEVLVFSALFNHTGLRSPFTYEGRASECRTDLSNLHYQLGSAFISPWDGEVKLLIDEAEGGATCTDNDFKRVLLRTSTDGKTFTSPAAVNPFIEQSVIDGTTVSMIEVTLVPEGDLWWGIFRWCSDSPAQVANGRLQVHRDPANPRGFRAEYLASDGSWAPILDDGSFEKLPLNIGQDAKAIHFNPERQSFEVWTDIFGLPADQGCADTHPFTSSFRVLTAGPDFLGAPRDVHSEVRAMPTLLRLGRTYPFRVDDNNGKKLLYSASRDRVCEAGLEPEGFRGMEIVLTVLEPALLSDGFESGDLTAWSATIP